MEIEAWMFFSFWAIIGLVSLSVGIRALEGTDLLCSIPPIVMSFFKHFLKFSACHSATYALVLRPKLQISLEYYLLMASFNVSPGVVTPDLLARSWTVSCLIAVYSVITVFVLSFYLLPKLKALSVKEINLYLASVVIVGSALQYYLCSHFLSLPWYYGLSRCTVFLCLASYIPGLTELSGIHLSFFAVSTLYPTRVSVLIPFVSFFTAAIWAAVPGELESFHRWPQIVLSFKGMLRKNGKAIEFAIGMVGAIMFQNFFRITSFDHVLAFLYLAVAWLANIALLMASHDFGIFNFLLSNVIVGCTVSQFGIRGTTWIMYGASVLLYILRMKLESLVLVTRREGEAAVVVWRDETTAELQDVNVIVE